MKRLGLVLLMCALLFAACAGEDAVDTASPGEADEPDVTEPDEPDATEPDEPVATEPDATEPDDAAAVTPEALDFEATLLTGEAFRGSDFGGRDVALWFWAPW